MATHNDDLYNVSPFKYGHVLLELVAAICSKWLGFQPSKWVDAVLQVGYNPTY